MKNYKDSYSELKKNVNDDNSKIITFLIFGILIGRLYEKFNRIKTKIIKERK